MAYPRRKATHGTNSLTTASASVMALNVERKYAEFFNASDVVIWLAIGIPAVVGAGIMVPAGASYSVDDDNMTHAAVFGIAASGAAKVLSTLELS